ncbi:MAG: FprA family A-type flavoprotein [Coriobacteriia bacterium]|nr:FprA family A-type flavoprotein [Coriobacteriia bacterium]
MQATRVSDGIHWVGAIDWNLRDFHGFETPNGTTYNAYLVQGADKTALVDTVKLQFVPELLERIVEVVTLDTIDYIVVNHVEPDHNSGLRAVMEAMPQAKVVASSGGVKGIAGYHGPDLKVDAVGPDDVIDLGGKTLRFLPMPMVHWPDSMFTFCAESGTLMPNDAFGQHLATSERFADEIDLKLAVEELVIYYANILTPVATAVGKSISKIIDQGWVCDVIAPSHGVIWRHDQIPTVFDTYDRLIAEETDDKIVIVYSTMWGSTDVLAREIADGAAAEGVDVALFDIALSSLANITRHMVDARALLVGSPTLHHGMLYRVAGLLQYLSGIKLKNKIGGAFGSFGWSGGATKQMSARLEEIGFELPYEALTCRYKPSGDDIAAARAWGAQYAQLVKARGAADDKPASTQERGAE